MTVQEFLTVYKNDIPEMWDSYISFEDWRTAFYQKTLVFHQETKQSYFEQVGKIIAQNNYDAYYPDLVKYAYSGLFTKNDEISFVILIQQLIAKTDSITVESEMQELLEFIYSLSDFFVHEYFPENRLRSSLTKLKAKIIEKENLDKEGTRESIFRFFDLML
ncbi:hypothetical protein [Flavobacterium silvaticum]|uniref:Uncharacterized protein n=1 Tax=Flavobacterium silvaticum TaxID=1852020 RepID=A0A972JF79_9FLAO|nr:hypothetical protein [Flavobacterium silvaticum]NMH27674.1 hypothetical protein [Flavobacterium silvaticum]